MKSYVLFFCLLITGILSAQETRSVGPFDELVVSGKLDVYLEKGKTDQIVIESADYPEDELNISLRGGRLKLSLVEGWIKGDYRLKVRVQYRELDLVKATAGATLQSREVINADRFDLSAGSGAEISLELDINTLEALVSEGAQMELNGKVERQYVTATTGGRYEGDRLEAQRTEVKANTGGEAEVVARQHLDATANTGGRIRYEGDPEERYTRSNLAGEIRRY